MDLFLVLGCFGRRDDDFISCSGAENAILKIEEKIVNYSNLLDYLDQSRLFDKPTFDINSIRHTIFYIQEKFDQVHKKLWKENKFILYQKFLIDHRNCGLYLKLVMAEEENILPELPPDKIFVPGLKVEAKNNVIQIKKV